MLGRPLSRSALLGRHAGGPEVPHWPQALDELTAELEQLNRSTEQDFLAVGGRLMEFLSVARQISSDMADLTGLVSGVQGRNASQALTGMLDRARAMDTRLAQSGQALESLRDLARRVQFSFSKLGETVALFRALCTLTRIETSRLGGGGSDFSYLADEVKPLSERIGSTGRGVLDEAARLDQSVESALRTSSQISTQQVQELHSLITRVVESLNFFEERQQRAREASARQSAQFSAVTAGIQDLVGSIQFHDITRQQIEHVSQGLREIRSQIAASSDRENVVNARAVLTLQRSQLSSSARAFAAAMERVNSGLDGIGARVNEMADASAALLGFSEGERESFFLRMENCFTGILQAAGNCAAAETALGSTASQVESTIVTMRSAVYEIRGIEIQIQRIAMNASIRSAHLGSSGDALNVLADVMHRVAFESNLNTEQAAAALDSMSRTLQSASAGTENRSAEGSSGSDKAAGEMRNAMGELHSASERSFTCVNRVVNLNARLRDDIRSLRDGLSVGPLFAQVVARAGEQLERMGAQAGPLASGNLDEASAESMDRFAMRYTMQAEREVHQSLTKSAATSNAVPAEENAAPDGAPRILPDGENLGDNVELF